MQFFNSYLDDADYKTGHEKDGACVCPFCGKIVRLERGTSIIICLKHYHAQHSPAYFQD